MSARPPAQAPRPAAAAALVAGALLSIATTPVVDDGTRYAETGALSGALTVGPGAPGVIALRAEVRCAAPGAAGDPLPLVDGAWVETRLTATSRGDGPDTAARTHVVVRVVTDGVDGGVADEEWLRDDDQVGLGAAGSFGAGCALGTPCTATFDVAIEADADVDVTWTATASAQWNDVGATCLAFLSER